MDTVQELSLQVQAEGTVETISSTPAWLNEREQGFREDPPPLRQPIQDHTAKQNRNKLEIKFLNSRALSNQYATPKLAQTPPQPSAHLPPQKAVPTDLKSDKTHCMGK